MLYERDVDEFEANANYSFFWTSMDFSLGVATVGLRERNEALEEVVIFRASGDVGGLEDKQKQKKWREAVEESAKSEGWNAPKVFLCQYGPSKGGSR